MRRRGLETLLTAIALLWPLYSAALSSDPRQPIHIQADRVEIDERRGISTYTGRVEVSQGSLHVEADRIIIYKQGDRLKTLEADGKPVRFRQRPDNAEKDIRGQALHVEYDAATARVLLKGQGHIWRGDDEFSGEQIVYDAKQSVVQAKGSGGESSGRVHAIIRPPREEEQEGK